MTCLTVLTLDSIFAQKQRKNVKNHYLCTDFFYTEQKELRPTTMIEGFEHITHEEFGTLRDALPMIATLIGGADGDFDKKEQDWANKIVKIYAFSKKEPINIFFTKVADHFPDKAEALYRHYPKLEERNNYLSSELEKLNAIFPQLKPHDAYRIYKSFLHFAEEIAKASGGIFRMGAIKSSESKWIDLPMIKPIAKPVD